MIYQITDFDKMKNEDFAFVYITSKTCSVCKVLAPRLEKLAAQYSKSTFHRIELDDNPEAKGYFMAFTIPTFLVYADGNELIRSARHLDMGEIAQKLSRYHSMLYLDQ